MLHSVLEVLIEDQRWVGACGDFFGGGESLACPQILKTRNLTKSAILPVCIIIDLILADPYVREGCDMFPISITICFASLKVMRLIRAINIYNHVCHLPMGITLQLE